MGHLDTPGLVGEEEAQDQQQALVGIRDSYNKYKTNYKLIHRTKPERPIQDIYFMRSVNLARKGIKRTCGLME